MGQGKFDTFNSLGSAQFKNKSEGIKMKKYEITYMENGEYKSLIIYGKENYQVFLDENINYIDIISVAEF